MKMRALDRLISFIFSVIMLMVSVVLILVGVGLVEPQMLIDMLNEYVFVKDMISSNTFNALTITGIVLLLASLKTTITTIVGTGVIVVGNLKINDIQSNSVSLISKKEKIFITGDELKIKSISKGEIVIAGNIKNIDMECLCKT